MDHWDPLQSRTGLNSLPHELLEHIVELVSAQDRGSTGWSIDFASPSTAHSRDEHQGALQDDKLSWWYGHGVSALSLVSKNLRSFALPHLLKSVTAAQLEKPIFQYGRVPAGMLAGVEELDLLEANSSSFAAAARALRRLPRVDRITYSARRGGQLDQRAEKDALAWQAFAAHTDKITTLTIHDLPTLEEVEESIMVKLAKPEALRRLKVCGAASPSWLHSYQCLLADTFTRLEVLQDRRSAFHSHVPGPVASGAWHGAVFTRLRELELLVSDVKVFEGLRSWAPNLVTVQLTVPETFLDDEDLALVTPVLLPELRELTLRGGWSCTRALALVDISLLAHVRLFITSRNTLYVNWAGLLPAEVTLPRGLDLDVSVHALNIVQTEDDKDDKFFADLVERDVRLTNRVMDPLAAFRPPSSLVDEGSALEDASLARAIAAGRAAGTAKWRVQRAMEVGDARAVQEMAETLRKVEERRVLESL